MLQINKLVSFDDHVWNEMFARLISVNYLSEVANFMWEQQLPAFFLQLANLDISHWHIGTVSALFFPFFVFLRSGKSKKAFVEHVGAAHPWQYTPNTLTRKWIIHTIGLQHQALGHTRRPTLDPVTCTRV